MTTDNPTNWNAVLPTNTILGHLTMDTISDFYDGPVLFLCRNTDGVRYLVTTIELDHPMVYCYLPISEARYQALQAKQIDLYTAILKPEDGRYLVTMNPEHAIVQELRMIKRDQLPEPGEYWTGA